MEIFHCLRNAAQAPEGNGLPPEGSLGIDPEFRAAISWDIRHAKNRKGRSISRYEVAARMSGLTGQEITPGMLYSYYRQVPPQTPSARP